MRKVNLLVSKELPENFAVRVGNLAHETIDFMQQPAVNYSDVTPKILPESGGVYAIFIKDTDKALFINHTSNLRSAIYTHQLMGNGRTSSIKGLLCDDEDLPEIIDMTIAKAWLQENCHVRWLGLDDYRKRSLLSHGLRFMLSVKYIPEHR
jgi:hypothetical protein